MDLASKLFKGDRVIWLIFMFICLISVVEVFSATSMLAYKNVNHWAPIVRHASFLMGGAVLVFFLHNVPDKFLTLGILVLPISILLLIFAMFFGETVNGASRWLTILGFQFQPSEFAKLGCIIFVSFMLSLYGKFSEIQIYRSILIGVGISCALIFPENFSTAAILFLVCYMLMFIGDISFKRLFLLGTILLLLAASFLSVLIFTPPDVLDKVSGRAVTWQNRIKNFSSSDDKLDINTYKINDDNYQVSHAKIAIAKGGIIGKMPGHGQQRDFLPQAYSDFIYAIVIEELGVVGGLFVLLLYIMLLLRVGFIARRCDRLFQKYLVLGCGLLLVVQALANISVAVSLVPVTGQPLPLMSRGGTSTVLTCIYFGIILSISRFSAHMGEEELDEDEIDTDNVEKEPEVSPELLTQLK